MGSFDFEKNILKRYARRGQCFSTSKFIMSLEKDKVIFNYPDIKRNGYTFTDGCGQISYSLATKISKEFGHNNTCSAFQIRIGGSKGILMVVPDDLMKSNFIQVGDEFVEQDVLIRLRESQIKFQSNDLTLNVVRCATFSQGFLNRQLIILLSCIGVPDEVFMTLQQKAKETVSVSEIYKKLILNVDKVYKSFKKQSLPKKAAIQDIISLFNLKLGPSKWF